jgi:hypothetical protein
MPPSELIYLDEIATGRHCGTVAVFETRHWKLN